MSWWEAERFCAARGQVLARIDSRATARELHAAARAVSEAMWWVGLDDREREGAYRWQDGSRADRALWAKGEPDHYACGQHCAAMLEHGRGRLRDMHCATRAPFVCGHAMEKPE
jgi:hypothetical protein